MNADHSASPPNMFSRRGFLHGLTASGILAASARAEKTESALPALRSLTDGRPLIGTAVPSNFEKDYTVAESDILARHFDSVTPENCMKWQDLCPKEGEYRFEAADNLMRFAKKNQQSVVGHTLLFNRDGNYPDWLFRNGEKEADAKLVWKRVENHVTKLMTRYAGQIESWDVLNEFVEAPTPGYRVTDLTRVLGADYPVRLFKLAAEIDPKAKLTYNDFAVETPERLKAILAFVRNLRDKGCRVDVVGSQSHLEITDPAAEQIDTMIKQLAAEGFNCALTELDIDVISRKNFWNSNEKPDPTQQNPYADGCPAEILERQAELYRKVIETVMANRKHVDRVTLWGISDRHSWLNYWPWERVNHGLLFNRDSKPKPAFHAFAEALTKK
ncbi:MAG: endo-1,4-beta-xylanase [Verrucomicrobiota bacterium]